MATTYLPSSNVSVAYPNVERTTKGASCALSEPNVVASICAVTPNSTGTFIANFNKTSSTDIEIIGGETTVDLYLGGYNFKFIIPAANLSECIWVGIKLTTISTDTYYSNYTELLGTDSSNTYTGLHFGATSADLPSDCTYTMQLMTTATTSTGVHYYLNNQYSIINLWRNVIAQNDWKKAFFIDTISSSSTSGADLPENYVTNEVKDKLWVCLSTDGTILEYYDDTDSTNPHWVRLGAVFK